MTSRPRGRPKKRKAAEGDSKTLQAPLKKVKVIATKFEMDHIASLAKAFCNEEKKESNAEIEKFVFTKGSEEGKK